MNKEHICENKYVVTIYCNVQIYNKDDWNWNVIFTWKMRRIMLEVFVLKSILYVYKKC
jgi:hypothetical protein